MGTHNFDSGGTEFTELHNKPLWIPDWLTGYSGVKRAHYVNNCSIERYCCIGNFEPSFIEDVGDIIISLYIYCIHVFASLLIIDYISRSKGLIT